MAGDYDPGLQILRELLAFSIMGRLNEAGFAEDAEPDIKTKERVFSRAIDESISVKVYTTVVGQEVRSNGMDAIRVCAVYKTKSGDTKGIVKSTRVHRTGNIEEIVDRMLHRMRDTWKSAKTSKKCYKCNAPTFVAKSGKTVCAEICWIPPEQKEAEKLEYKFKAAASRHRRTGRKGRKY